ncbi:MAG TPA: MoaD/ThiS family protein [Blastocatellia bacterium]|nr:MoaD/ThiS family protein [Blastocatellia bacterium]
MKVHVPSALRSYTGLAEEVEAEGATLGQLLRELDRLYPGFRFRIIDEQDSIRPHIKIFVNYDQASDLRVALRDDDEVSILLALSGGSADCTRNSELESVR